MSVQTQVVIPSCNTVLRVVDSLQRNVASAQSCVVCLRYIDLTNLPCDVSDLRAELSCDEVERAERFCYDSDRRRFMVVRAALRRILGWQLGVEGNDLTFDYGQFGKPEISTAARLQFNVSHSGDLAVVATSVWRRVGVDIELIHRGIECEQLASRFFSRSEAEILAGLPDGDRTSMFYKIWTRKESLLKATGLGLSVPLSAFQVLRNEKYRDGAFEMGSPRTWCIYDLMPPTSAYVGAVTVEAEEDDSVILDEASWDWEA